MPSATRGEWPVCRCTGRRDSDNGCDHGSGGDRGSQWPGSEPWDDLRVDRGWPGRRGHRDSAAQQEAQEIEVEAGGLTKSSRIRSRAAFVRLFSLSEGSENYPMMRAAVAAGSVSQYNFCGPPSHRSPSGSSVFRKGGATNVEPHCHADSETRT